MNNGPDHEKLKKVRDRIQVILNELDDVEQLSLLGSMLTVGSMLCGMSHQEFKKMFDNISDSYQKSFTAIQELKDKLNK